MAELRVRHFRTWRQWFQRPALFALLLIGALQLTLVILKMSAAPSEADKIAKHIQSLVGSLAAAPPEIAAHCFLRIAISGKANAASTKDLVERAFSLAAFSSRNVQFTAAIPAGLYLGENDAAVASAAGKQRVDTLSLQCRAVRAMLGLNVSRAREMFDEIRLEVPPTTCSDSLRPNVDTYYRAMLEMFGQTFNTSEREDGKDVEWFAAHAHVHSAVEVGPVARALLEFRTKREILGSLSGTLATEIADLRPDDRSFTSSLSDASTAIEELGTTLRSLQLSIHGLSGAWAGYVKRGLMGPRCQESMVDDQLGVLLSAKQTVERLNAAQVAWELPETKLDLREIKPKIIVGEHADLQPYWSSPTNRKIQSDYRILRFGSPEQQEAYAATKRNDGLVRFLSIEQRRTHEWLASALEFMQALQQWKEGLGETSLAHFAMITMTYASLLDVVPPDDPLFETVLDSYIQLLRDSPLKKSNPSIWLSRTSLLIDGFAGAKPAELAVVRSRIRVLGDSTMAALVDVFEFTKRQ